jgi:hypothetical protein
MATERSDGGGRAATPGLDTPTITATNGEAIIAGRRDCPCCTPDPRRRAALDRLHEQQQAVRIATALERLAPLRAYYCRRRVA